MFGSCLCVRCYYGRPRLALCVFFPTPQRTHNCMRMHYGHVLNLCMCWMICARAWGVILFFQHHHHTAWFVCTFGPNVGSMFTYICIHTYSCLRGCEHLCASVSAFNCPDIYLFRLCWMGRLCYSRRSISFGFGCFKKKKQSTHNLPLLVYIMCK